MNIEQAKQLPLAQILATLGYTPAKEKGNKAVYSSPLRSEKTPSFHVDHAKNVWFDFGSGEGGSIIDFAVAYLKSTNEPDTVSDALRWLANMAGDAPIIRPIPVYEPEPDNPVLVLKKLGPLKHKALLRYLHSRGITGNLAARHVSEALVLNTDTGKKFYALAFANEDEGHEIRNPYFKGCIGPKTISFIRGTKAKPDGIHIFEGFIDFLSAVARNDNRPFPDDAIVLNSLSCLKFATPYIKNYGYRMAYTWLDNDAPGDKGTTVLAEFFKTEQNLTHKPMNAVYAPHQDVNAWHSATLQP